MLYLAEETFLTEESIFLPVQCFRRQISPLEPKNDDVHDESIMRYIIIIVI